MTTFKFTTVYAVKNTATYRELQSELKKLRSLKKGVAVRLNSKRSILEMEYIRLLTGKTPVTANYTEAVSKKASKKSTTSKKAGKKSSRKSGPTVGQSGKTYRELQQFLKALRESGVKINVRLNSKREVLEAEYARLAASASAPAKAGKLTVVKSAPVVHVPSVVYMTAELVA